MSHMDWPVNSEKCEYCGQAVYEDEFYGCDCGDDRTCDGCGDRKKGGPYRECYQHYHLETPGVQAELFGDLLSERDRLLIQLKNANIQIDSLRIIISEMQKTMTATNTILDGAIAAMDRVRGV